MKLKISRTINGKSVTVEFQSGLHSIREIEDKVFDIFKRLETEQAGQTKPAAEPAITSWSHSPETRIIEKLSTDEENTLTDLLAKPSRGEPL